jgi:xanthine dehydrogenase iron-sulfur-binding subunit
MEKNIKFILNSEEVSVDVDVRKSLLDLLRLDFGLTGAKEGCSVGECGACAVLIDGIAVDTCIYLAVWADGKNIRTVESFEKDGELSNMQKSFAENGAVQCGFCTPGFIITATEMEETGECFTKDDIKLALSGHLCRCTGYTKIVEAAEKGLKNSCSCNHN